MVGESAQTGHRVAPPSGGLLTRLVGTELNRVVFVMDYLQLGFQDDRGSPVLNCYVWPELRSLDTFRRETESGYTDALRSLIGHTVTTATAANGAGLVLSFASGFSLSLVTAADEAVVEIAELRDFPDHALEVWRAGEFPFDQSAIAVVE